MEEVEHIADIIKQMKSSVQQFDAATLSSISNQTLHQAAAHQDMACITLAVLIYTLSKLVERQDYRRIKNWDKSMKKLNAVMDLAVVALRENNESKYNDYLESARRILTSISVNLKPYIREVMRKASINKASKIYEHGISMGRTAKMLGITQWELSEYTGQRTNVENPNPYNETIDVKESDNGHGVFLMKALIFDSGALINLSMNGLLYILPELKKNFDGKFLITKQVKYETVDRPIGIERFELGALQVENLITTGILEMPESLGIKEKDLTTETRVLLDVANHLLQVKGQWVHLVEEAEMSCIALCAKLDELNIETLIAIDERTARVLCENPENLEQLMSAKLHQNVRLVNERNDAFAHSRFIRSSELVYVAYKKGALQLKGKKVLEAALYATKFKGSSISFDEINILKKM